VTEVRNNSQNTAPHKAQGTDTVDYILPRFSKKWQKCISPTSWLTCSDKHSFQSRTQISIKISHRLAVTLVVDHSENISDKTKKTASEQLAFDSQQAKTITSYLTHWLYYSPEIIQIRYRKLTG